MTTRAELEDRIATCEQARDENRDHPELVARLNDRIDLLQSWHDAIPEQRDD